MEFLLEVMYIIGPVALELGRAIATII